MTHCKVMNLHQCIHPSLPASRPIIQMSNRLIATRRSVTIKNNSKRSRVLTTESTTKKLIPTLLWLTGLQTAGTHEEHLCGFHGWPYSNIHKNCHGTKRTINQVACSPPSTNANTPPNTTNDLCTYQITSNKLLLQRQIQQTKLQ